MCGMDGYQWPAEDRLFQIYRERPNDLFLIEEGATPIPRPGFIPTAATIEILRLAEENRTLKEERDALAVANRDLGLATFDKVAADRLADEVAALVVNRHLDSRSAAADALLDYREPPRSERSDRIVALEGELNDRRPQIHLLTMLLERLMTVCGERGQSEGALDTLARIMEERKSLEEENRWLRAEREQGPAAFTTRWFSATTPSLYALGGVTVEHKECLGRMFWRLTMTADHPVTPG